MKRYAKTKMDANGRIVIPAEWRRALGMQAGQTIALDLEDTEIRVYTMRESLRRAQELSRPNYLDTGRSWVDELIAERRAEAEREERE